MSARILVVEVGGRSFNHSFKSCRFAVLTVREVAERLRVCTATVYRLCESGRLWHLRVSNAVRVPEMALRAFIEAAAGEG